MIYAKDSRGGIGTFFDIKDIPPDYIEVTKDEFDKFDFEGMKLQGGYLAKPLGKQIFLKELKLVLGGVIKYNNFLTTYPVFMHAYDDNHWDDINAIFDDAVTKKLITKEQLKKIKDLETNYILF